MGELHTQRNVQTLQQFILEREKNFAYATGELSSLLRQISLAARVINREVNKAGLVDILGLTGKENLHGEEVKKLDVYAHNELAHAMEMGKECCIFGSEEAEDVIKSGTGHYVVLVDPLDGSSNIDVNVSIGTIFAIYRRTSDSMDPADMRSDAKQTGHKQVAAGYVIYGSSTMLVYTTGHGVNGFTLDPSIGEFILSHPDMQLPKRGKYYSINQGYYHMFDKKLQRYLSWLQEEGEGRPYSLRYIGTLVADIHRTLMLGGIFMYPATTKNPEGKLRLLYECNPMAMLVEQAGGKATDGRQRILDVEPKRLHQRIPLFIGSEEDVDMAMKFLNED